MYPGNNYQQHRTAGSDLISFKQVELTRTIDGTRRLFRGELNGKVTGFIEKHFKGNELIRDFALGGPRNGVNEAIAKARFNGVDIAPLAESEPVMQGLPDFLMKSSKPAPARPSPKAQPSLKPPPAKPTQVKRVANRREAMELAGKLRT